MNKFGTVYNSASYRIEQYDEISPLKEILKETITSIRMYNNSVLIYTQELSDYLDSKEGISESRNPYYYLPHSYELFSQLWDINDDCKKLIVSFLGVKITKETMLNAFMAKTLGSND